VRLAHGAIVAQRERIVIDLVFPGGLGSRLRAWRGRSHDTQGHAGGRNGTASQGTPSADPLDSLFRDEAP